MSEPYIGEIRMFAGSFAPVGWALCDGQLLAVAQNGALFSLLGTMYGGDGQSNFNLPDLRGRIPVHSGGNSPGPGLTTRPVGQPGGAEQVAVTANQIPPHSHSFGVSSAGANQVSPEGNVPARIAYRSYQRSASANVSMSSEMIGAAGGNQPHSNMMPYTCISFIIALYGIYPSAN